MLTARQLKIIQTIINNPGIHGKELEEQLRVSSRTIRNEITFMNDVTNCTLISSSSKKGYMINEEHLDKVQMLLKQDNENVELAINRIYKIIGNVIFYEDCSLYELAEFLGLSESVIRKEIYKASDYLRKNYNVELFKIEKETCVLLLDEVEIRELLFKIIKDTVLENNDSVSDVMYMILNDSWLMNYYQGTKDDIIKITNAEQIYLSENDLTIFTGCILVCRARNLNGYMLEETQDTCPDDLCMRIITKLYMNTAYLEKTDVSILYNLLHTFKFSNADEIPEITEFSRVVFDEFCNEVFDKYSINLKESESLSQKMLLHVEFMNRRVIGGYELKNPIVNDVKTKFPFAFEISMMIVPILFKYKRVYVTEDEISYLTVYVAHFLENENSKLQTVIVTSHRHSVKQLLVNWLDMYFKNQIEIVSIVEKNTCKSMDLSNIDLVITLDSFILLENVEVFRMDKLPEIKDIEKLNNVIHIIRMNRRVAKILDTYIQQEDVVFYEDAKDISQVLKDLSVRLEKRGCIESAKKFYEDVSLREKNYPTNIGTNVMVPHALFTFAKKTGIEVAVLRKPLMHHETHVQVIFLLALEKQRNDEMNWLFQFFNQIVSHRKYMSQLLHSKNKVDFIRNLHSFKLLE